MAEQATDEWRARIDALAEAKAKGAHERDLRLIAAAGADAAEFMAMVNQWKTMANEEFATLGDSTPWGDRSPNAFFELTDQIVAWADGHDLGHLANPLTAFDRRVMEHRDKTSEATEADESALRDAIHGADRLRNAAAATAPSPTDANTATEARQPLTARENDLWEHLTTPATRLRLATLMQFTGENREQSVSNLMTAIKRKGWTIDHDQDTQTYRRRDN